MMLFTFFSKNVSQAAPLTFSQKRIFDKLSANTLCQMKNNYLSGIMADYSRLLIYEIKLILIVKSKHKKSFLQAI